MLSTFEALHRTAAKGGVISRQRLFAVDENYTAFYTDREDARIGVLNRVFGNVYDFGAIFSRAPYAVPNIYGPIQIVFKTPVWSSLSDIVITPESVANLRASWRKARLSEGDLEKLLAGDDYGSPVASAFHYSEVSCEQDIVSFEHVEKIVVEPIEIGDESLFSLVTRELENASQSVPVTIRNYRNTANLAGLKDLITMCGEIPRPQDQQEFGIDTENLP